MRGGEIQGGADDGVAGLLKRSDGVQKRLSHRLEEPLHQLVNLGPRIWGSSLSLYDDLIDAVDHGPLAADVLLQFLIVDTGTYEHNLQALGLLVHLHEAHIHCLYPLQFAQEGGELGEGWGMGLQDIQDQRLNFGHTQIIHRSQSDANR